jgi:ribosomal protein S18 acetylase RimI-like enzyme
MPEPPASVEIRALGPEDLSLAEALLDDALGGRVQARLGEVVDVLGASGAAAWDGPDLAGVATWTVEGPRAEVLVIAVAEPSRGLGVAGALVEVAVTSARQAGCHTVWLVTTNDNLEALRLYQRHGFRLTTLRPGAVDAARRLKPSIPRTGAHGIPLRDELVLERGAADTS